MPDTEEPEVPPLYKVQSGIGEIGEIWGNNGNEVPHTMAVELPAIHSQEVMKLVNIGKSVE